MYSLNNLKIRSSNPIEKVNDRISREKIIISVNNDVKQIIEIILLEHFLKLLSGIVKETNSKNPVPILRTKKIEMNIAVKKSFVFFKILKTKDIENKNVE